MTFYFTIICHCVCTQQTCTAAVTDGWHSTAASSCSSLCHTSAVQAGRHSYALFPCVCKCHKPNLLIAQSAVISSTLVYFLSSQVTQVREIYQYFKPSQSILWSSAKFCSMSHIVFISAGSVTFWLWLWSGFRTLCHAGPSFLCNLKSLWRWFEFWHQNIPMFHVEFLVLASLPLLAALHHCPLE